MMRSINVQEINSFSRNSVYLQMLFDGQLLACGSGLLARYIDGRVFLVTALHNFTGREPNGECKSATLALPNQVRITGYHFDRMMPLYAGDHNPASCNPMFWRHPDGATVDVCVLPVPEPVHTAVTLDSSFLDPQRHASGVQLHIAQICFVVGYPEGLFVRLGPQAVLPIWKTGHLASEPSVPVDGQPKLLIDAATCAGMSGSPVYVRTNAGNRLVGIYVGRTSQISELGYVFTPECIQRIIATGPTLGPIPYQAS